MSTSDVNTPESGNRASGTRNFCTFFDSGYLTRGVALYESLADHDDDFHLYIVAFDEDCARILTSLSLEHATVIPLADIEAPDLLAAKPSRTWTEYCWTCTPSVVRYAIDTFELDHCTYLDADMCFWASPALLLNEFEGHSVGLTEHRYTPKYENSKRSGVYCVQFVPFRNDTDGNEALDWWRAACIEWCYNRREDGKFGDQMYMNDWLDRFSGVTVIENIGGAIAPWNVQQYDIFERDGQLMCRLKKTGEEAPLVFFHFHMLRIGADKVDLGKHRVEDSVVELLYAPYMRRLDAAAARIANASERITNHGNANINGDKIALARHALKGNVHQRPALTGLGVA